MDSRNWESFPPNSSPLCLDIYPVTNTDAQITRCDGVDLYQRLPVKLAQWFYLPVFWKRGVRLYKKKLFQIYAYYGIHWIAAKIYNLLGFEKSNLFLVVIRSLDTYGSGY